MTTTTGPWHVNAIKGNRIVGDETAPEFDKLYVSAPNATVGVICRRSDARLIAQAPAMLAGYQDIVSDYEAALAKCSTYTRDHAMARGVEPRPVQIARAILRAVEG